MITLFEKGVYRYQIGKDDFGGFINATENLQYAKPPIIYTRILPDSIKCGKDILKTIILKEQDVVQKELDKNWDVNYKDPRFLCVRSQKDGQLNEIFYVFPSEKTAQIVYSQKNKIISQHGETWTMGHVFMIH